ncbi:DUF6228 family protein [Actinophytocola sp.]|uniref:DUF6228 family protein n=1 Tax=Actinophytocola sp. TaxID=1872138 RepID=UPI002ED62D08
MDCVFDDSLGEDAALAIGEPRGPQVRLWNRVDPWVDGSMEICVQLALADEAESLAATAHGITVGIADETLSSFFDRLAEDFAGWENVRTWETLSHDLRVDAAHVSGGYADLTWTLASRPDSWRSRQWSASVTVRLEAGEQMRRLAAAVHRFLHPPDQVRLAALP